MAIERVEDLYELPPQEFVAARDLLVDKLKAEGRADEAKTVRNLKRPSLSVWTVNQLARQAADKVEQLLRTRAAIEGASSAQELRSRTEDRRRAMGSLLADARKILEDGGHSASVSTLDKVAQTLLAAGEDDKGELLSGTLTADLVATTTYIGGFAAGDAASMAFGEEADDKVDLKAAERAREELQKAEHEAKALEREARKLEATAEQAVMAAEKARAQADKTRARARALKQSK